MALITTAKATSANSNTPSRVITRQEVSVGKQPASTARAQALKDRLTGKTPSQPVAPRPAGSTARREEMAKVQKFTTTPAPTSNQPPPQASRPNSKQNLAEIEPPPSGLAPGQEAVRLHNTVEAPSKPAEATSTPLSPQLAALARQEQQIRKARQELKAAQDAWKQDQANYIPKQQLTSDTLKVLADLGITNDKLVELQINQASPADPNQALINEISELKKQLQGITDPENGTFAQRDKQAYEQAVEQIRNDTKLLVESNPSYGTIKSENRINDVVELITSVFNEEGKILDVEEAAQLVEDKLADNLYKQYERISQYEKIKARLGRQAEAPAEANPVQPTQQNRVNTLTNEGTSSRPLSARDRAVLLVQERMNAAKGK